jgi:hypothetical protein
LSPVRSSGYAPRYNRGNVVASPVPHDSHSASHFLLKLRPFLAFRATFLGSSARASAADGPSFPSDSRNHCGDRLPMTLCLSMIHGRNPNHSQSCCLNVDRIALQRLRNARLAAERLNRCLELKIVVTIRGREFVPPTRPASSNCTFLWSPWADSAPVLRSRFCCADCWHVLRKRLPGNSRTREESPKISIVLAPRLLSSMRFSTKRSLATTLQSFETARRQCRTKKASSIWPVEFCRRTGIPPFACMAVSLRRTRRRWRFVRVCKSGGMERSWCRQSLICCRLPCTAIHTSER